jgi:hypothetical protein
LFLRQIEKTDQEGTREMNRNSVLNVTVQTGGTHVVAHAGLHALGAFADRIGLGAALSQAIAWSGERAPTHDRGVVLTHAMLMLAAGGEACSDIEFLSSQLRLFGAVASDSTLYRTVRNIGPTVLADLVTAVATVRPGMWRRMGATSGTSMVVLDIDASLIEVHSENKQGTGPTYKGGFGYHPLLCLADATGEALAGCCARATPARTQSPITSPCSTPRSLSSRWRSPLVTMAATAPRWSAVACRSAPIRPVAPTGSFTAAGPATSGSRSSPVPTPVFMP